MDMLIEPLDYLINLDVHLNELIVYFGNFIYVVLFSIIFCETGLVITSFLPGDSLLFIVGALSSGGTLNIGLSIIILISASILGDTSNYYIGRYLGPKIFKRDKVMFFNKKHILKAHNFYDKHGGKTVTLARFLPIFRTFVPFTAGMGGMPYRRFIGYSILGSVSWVLLFTLSGFFFGNINYVKNNFSLVLVAVGLFSTTSIMIVYFKNRKYNRSKTMRK
ncbi:MAG: VTT domain-containing protein [Clostridiaceae bacterium]|nr:VTT domain-containing protein [Clostridiaceae bacterium]